MNDYSYLMVLVVYAGVLGLIAFTGMYFERRAEKKVRRLRQESEHDSKKK